VKPINTVGDGNCLFRATSLALYGNDSYHTELRARCALEIALHREWYDASDARYCAPFKDDNRIVVVPYSELCESVTLDGQYSDILCILALSSVVEIPIQMYFPPLNASFDTQPLTRLISRVR